MRSMRCDVCGTKALTAASKCPKCGHGFEVRDGFGELLPLSHCATCDSYYPAKLGVCRWCGTQPERAAIGPYVWKGVGVLAFVAMAWGAWLVHDDPPADVSAARMKALLKPDSSAAADSAASPTMVASAGTVSVDSLTPTPTGVVSPETTLAVTSDAPADSVPGSPAAAVATREPLPPVDSTPAREPGPLPVTAPPARGREPDPLPATAPVRETREAGRQPVRDAAPPAVRSADRTPTRVVDRSPNRAAKKTPSRVSPRATTKPPRALTSAKAGTKSPARTPASTAAKKRQKSQWVTSVSRNWVIVRASASPQARIIASIGPNTRVQLGESRGAWRRVKAKGLAGWVEHRLFFAVVEPPRAGRLAVR